MISFFKKIYNKDNNRMSGVLTKVLQKPSNFEIF